MNLSIIQGAIPVFVLLAGVAAPRGGWLLAKPESGSGARIQLGQVAGVILALAGALLVASGGRFETLAGLRFNLGDLIMLGACALYAGYTVALRTHGAKAGIGAIGLFFGLALAGFVSSLPLLGLEAMLAGWTAPTAKGWAILVYVGLFASFVAHLFFIRAVQLIGPTRAGLFVNLVPVFGALLSVLVLGETFGLNQAAALVLVLGGIALSELWRR